jgi:hypothetical protein
MESFEYKPNKSYSTYLITMGFFAASLFVFNFINFRENTFIYTVLVFISVLSWIIYNSFFNTKEKYFLVFESNALTLPSKVTASGLKESIDYKYIKTATLFDGDIQNPKRPGYKGLELIFERVENIEETIFLQKNYFEPYQYNKIIDLLNLKLKEVSQHLKE